MRRLLLLLAILGATLFVSTDTAQAHRYYRGWYGYRARPYAAYYYGPRRFYRYPRVGVGYAGYPFYPTYYGYRGYGYGGYGYGGYCR